MDANDTNKNKYDPKAIEPKWQAKWLADKTYRAEDSSSKPKFYALTEFPYPSGDGLHTGHIRGYTAMDIVARKRRMEGHNVLYPIGWDAFGLPTENYAIKTGVHPRIVTKNNTDNFRQQFQAGGFSFDWDREINTTDPAYYKWTQWLFLQFLKHDLAYKAKMPINWCLSCKIGLANEEVIGGRCERCGGPTEKREKEQWMLAITKYADRLLSDLDTVNYLERIKAQQRNWIGKSEGAEINFKLVDVPGQPDGAYNVDVFTTRPDTIFGVTFMAISPELAKKWLDVGWAAPSEVKDYIAKALADRANQEFGEVGEKTGIFSGLSAINPANQEKVPVWIVNYVLGDVGTGAIMGVPAHDERDLEFATKFKLPIKEVVSDNKLINSGQFDAMDSGEAKKKITEFVGGKMTVRYKLRDWVFSRQRYWGEPIPVVYCDACAKTNPASGGLVPIPEKDLPVLLPEVVNYQPTDSGESPLAAITDWVNTTCPVCGGPAKRETDTMPNWAGSSWYFLRYTDPDNDKEFAAADKLKYWTPVDWYNGGMEHTTLHLLYSRFWHKFLFDQGLVPTSEPYQKRTSHGLILAEGGVKMSKSKGNVVNPNEIIDLYGADTLRVYEMFMGPFDQEIAWDTKSIIGPRRFIEKVWKLQERVEKEAALSRQGGTSDTDQKIKLATLVNQTIKKVSADIENMGFNTAISSLMILVNEMEKTEKIAQADYEVLLKLLAPFAPHVAEELWHSLGNKTSIHLEPWPVFDESQIKQDKVKIIVQVNGRVRGDFEVEAEMGEEEVKSLAQKLPTVDKWLEGKPIKQIIYIKGRLVNLVV